MADPKPFEEGGKAELVDDGLPVLLDGVVSSHPPLEQIVIDDEAPLTDLARAKDGKVGGADNPARGEDVQ